MARRSSEQVQIEDRMKYNDEDYMTARKAVRRAKLERAPWPLDDNFPGEKQIPDEGCWIQVIMPPHCEITCEPLSIWYAMPAFEAKTWDFMEGETQNRYKVKILTPIGEFMLFPSEYRIVTPESVHEYMNSLGSTGDPDQEHVMLHWLDPRNEYFDTDRLFYLMSRGLKRADAYQMLMGEVKSQHVCYFTFHVEYQEAFAGVGVMHLRSRDIVRKHIVFVAREKAAGRWYNAEYAKQQSEANERAEAEAASRAAKEAEAVKSLKRRNKAFANVLGSIRTSKRRTA